MNTLFCVEQSLGENVYSEKLSSLVWSKSTLFWCYEYSTQSAKKKKKFCNLNFLRGFWGSQKCSQLSWSYESLNDKTWKFYAPMAKLIVSHEVTVSCLSDGVGHFEFSNHVTPLCSRLLISTHTYVLTTNPAFLAFKLTQFLPNDKDSVLRRIPTIYYSRWRHNRRSLSCSLLGDKFSSEDLHILKVSLDLHEQMLQKYLILKLQFLKSQKLWKLRH